MSDLKVIPPSTRPKIYVGVVAPPFLVILCYAGNLWIKHRMIDPVDILRIAPSIPVVGGLGILALVTIAACCWSYRGFAIVLTGAVVSGAITTYLTFRTWFEISFF